ncbi:MAG: hypothetical protein OHK0038_28190 [Flammeovirgaceae bacterium]
MEQVPFMGSAYEASRNFEEGNYVQGTIAGIGFLTQGTGMKGGIPSASRKLFGHKNDKSARGDFSIYALFRNGELWKIGKADAGRKRMNGEIERIAQQLQRLRDYVGGRITREILETIPNSTTGEALDRENFWIKQLNSPQRTTERAKLKTGDY